MVTWTNDALELSVPLSVPSEQGLTCPTLCFSFSLARLLLVLPRLLSLLSGGPEILTNEAGTDATTKFEEVFHSDDARRQLKDFCVGTLKGYEGPKDAALKGKKGGATTTTSGEAGLNPAVYLVAAAAVAALVYVFVL
jgi:hypothetical protein